MKKENEIKDKIDENLTTQKKKNPTPFEITVFVLFIIFMIYSVINRDKISSFFNNNETIQTESKEVDKTFVVYNENNLLVKITNYEFSNLIDRIKVTFYIENNSDIETTFSISKDVSINDCMMNGGHLYENVKPHSKTIKEVSIYDLEKYDLDKNNIETLKFNFDIYHSEHYMITDRILDNQEFVYKFNK